MFQSVLTYVECTELSGYMQPVLAVRVNWEQPRSDPHEQHRNMTSPAAPCERKQKWTAVSIYGLLWRELLADIIEDRDEYKDGPVVSSGLLWSNDCFCWHGEWRDRGNRIHLKFQINAEAAVTLNSAELRHDVWVNMAQLWCKNK